METTVPFGRAISFRQLPFATASGNVTSMFATQTEEHLPPFELAPSSTWQIVETCIGELMFGPRGYSLLPLELF